MKARRKWLTRALLASVLVIAGFAGSVLVVVTQPLAAFAIAAPPKLFRPPGGLAWPRQLRLARGRGYSCVLGSAYPHDPKPLSVGYIEWLIEKNLAPRTIVILHDGIRDPRRSIAALPHILATGRERGIRFVSIGTLMAAATP